MKKRPEKKRPAKPAYADGPGFIGHESGLIGHTDNYQNLACKSSLYLHYLLIGLGLFFLMQDLLAENMRRIPALNKLIKSVDEVSSFMLFGLVIGTRIARGRLLPHMGINWPLFFFLILLLIPSFIYKIPPFIMISQLIIYLKAFLYLYTLASLNITKPLLNLYISAVFGAAVLIFGCGLIDFIAPVPFRRLTGNLTGVEVHYGLPAVKSLFIHPLLMGWFMSFMALYCFAYFLIKKKTAFLLTSLLFSFGCILSMKVKAIAGLGLCMAIGYFVAPLSHKLRAKIGFVLFPIILIGLMLFAPTITDLFETKINFYFNSENAMELARNILTYKSFEIARDYFPIGAGLGRYGSYLSKLYYSPLYYKYGLSRIWGMSKANPFFITDTFWPMIIGESGFIGLALYILIFFLILKFLYKEIKTDQDEDLKAFQLGTLLATIEGIVETIAAPVFVSPPAGFFILSAVGICYALKRTHRKT
jgi:hypothetical protein